MRLRAVRTLPRKTIIFSFFCFKDLQGLFFILVLRSVEIPSCQMFVAKKIQKQSEQKSIRATRYDPENIKSDRFAMYR